MKLIQLSLFILISLFGVLFFQNIIPNNQNIIESSKLQNHHYDNDQKELNIAIIGDYGFGNSAQQQVAYHLNDIAQEQKIDFILGVGDNFYKDQENPIEKPSGVTGINDKSWDTKWANIYQTQSYLQHLQWFGTIGNHDFNGKGLLSEFEYNKHGWVIDDFFWTHTASIGKQDVAFIHIDTNFLAYGIEGSDSQPLMKTWFQELGWVDQDQMLQMIEYQLQLYENYDWKILIAHHPVGFSCKKKKGTDKILDLIKKYKVDAYLSGHKHQLSYGKNENSLFLLSGAAGDFTKKDECLKKNDTVWSKGTVYGFLTFKLTKKQINVTAHYTDAEKVEWQTNEKNSLNQEWIVKELPTFKKQY